MGLLKKGGLFAAGVCVGVYIERNYKVPTDGLEALVRKVRKYTENLLTQSKNR